MAETARGRWDARVLAAAAVLGLLPLLLTLLLVSWRLDASIADFVPNFWNDQVGYWHRIGSFAEVGFGIGFYNPDEVLPPWEAVRYGVNGPWFPALYGSVAALTGWSLWTSILFNAGVVAIAVVAFARLARLTWRQLGVTALVLVTFWPLLIYLPTASQESLQQAFAIVLAGLFVRALARGPELSRREQALSLAFLGAISLTRFSWALLLPALVLAYMRSPSRRAVLLAGVGGALVGLALVRVTGLLQQAGQNSVSLALDRVRDAPFDGSIDLVETAWRNTKTLLYPGYLDPTSPTVGVRGSLDITGTQSWVIVAVLACMALLALQRWRGWRVAPGWLDAISSREAAFHAWNLGSIVVTSAFLYLPSGYYRLIGAHVLLSMLVLAARRGAVLALGAVAVNLIMLPSFTRAYDTWKPNFSLDETVVDSERAAYRRVLPYRDDPATPWCNTILVPIEAYDWRITLIPPGLGVSYYVGGEMRLPPKSAYVYLPPEPTALAGIVPPASLERLRTSAATGTIYRNPDSPCFG